MISGIATMVFYFVSSLSVVFMVMDEESYKHPNKRQMIKIMLFASVWGAILWILYVFFWEFLLQCYIVMFCIASFLAGWFYKR